MSPMSIPEAIRAAYSGRVRQIDLAERLGVSQATVSAWSSKEGSQLQQSLDQLAQLEQHADRPRGWILVAAGYVPEPKGVREAIEMDPSLDDAARAALLDAYESARSNVTNHRKRSC